MNKTVAIRAAGAVFMILLVGLLLAPVLWWDPTAVAPKGGEGYQALDEWARLERNDGDQVRRDGLADGFGTVRSHLGRAWFTAADRDGTCWALALDPVDVRPHRAEDASWCDRNGG